MGVGISKTVEVPRFLTQTDEFFVWLQLFVGGNFSSNPGNSKGIILVEKLAVLIKESKGKRLEVDRYAKNACTQNQFVLKLFQIKTHGFRLNYYRVRIGFKGLKFAGLHADNSSFEDRKFKVRKITASA